MKPEDARKQNLFPSEHHDAIKNSDLTLQTRRKSSFVVRLLEPLIVDVLRIQPHGISWCATRSRAILKIARLLFILLFRSCACYAKS